MEKEMVQKLEWLEAQKIEISIDLFAAAKQQLQFLGVVDRNRWWLYDGPILERAIYRYNAYWLPLLAKYSEHSQICEGPLVPPLDCEWVWHCHRLNPVRYKSDCEQFYGRILDNSGIVSSTDGSCKLQTENLWKRLYPMEPYDIDLDKANSEPNDISALENCTTYDLVSAVKRQSSFYNEAEKSSAKCRAEKNNTKCRAVEAEKSSAKCRAVEAEKNSAKCHAVEAKKNNAKCRAVEANKNNTKCRAVEAEKNNAKCRAVEAEKINAKCRAVEAEKNSAKYRVMKAEKNNAKCRAMEAEKNNAKCRAVEAEKITLKCRAVEAKKNNAKCRAVEAEKITLKCRAVETEKNNAKYLLVEANKNNAKYRVLEAENAPLAETLIGTVAA